MEKEFRLRQQEVRGAHAEQIKDTIHELLDDYKDRITEAFQDSKPSQVDVRESYHLAIHIIGWLRQSFDERLSSGKAAKKELDHLAAIKSGKRKLFH